MLVPIIYLLVRLTRYVKTLDSTLLMIIGLFLLSLAAIIPLTALTDLAQILITPKAYLLEHFKK